MTGIEYKAYKIYMQRALSLNVHTYTNKIKIGKLDTNIIDSIILPSIWIEMILNYTLFDENTTNFNPLGVEEMKDINFKLNEIFHTLYNPDFVLTE